MRRSCKAEKRDRFCPPSTESTAAVHPPDKREVAGSSPARSTSFDAAEKMSWSTRRSHKPPLGGFDSHLRNHGDVVQREDCWSAPSRWEFDSLRLHQIRLRS